MKALQLVAGTIFFTVFSAAAGCGSASPGAGLGGDAGDSDGSTTEDASVVSTPSRVVSDGYLTTGPWAGYGFTATDPGAAQIIPTCGTDGCDPPFVGKSFCMHGTVTGRLNWTGFAMLGWNVNQDTVDGPQLTWAVPETGGLIVTVENPGKTPLRVQLQGTNPHISSDRWCAPLVSGQLIPWSSLRTNCWAGGNPQDPLTPGTPIQQAAIIVPGLQVDLPFDFCLVDVQVVSGPANPDGGDDGAGGDDGNDGGSDDDGTTSEPYPG
jgi:hypothetical protein